MLQNLVWQFDLENIRWSELEHLYHVAPLGNKTAEGLSIAFSNSRYTCIISDGPQYIAAGRVLADGIDCAYVCDIAIHPDYQGLGLGKRIVTELVLLSQGHKKIILYSVPGKEGFYQKLGFRRMTTAMAIFEDQTSAQANGYITD